MIPAPTDDSKTLGQRILAAIQGPTKCSRIVIDIPVGKVPTATFTCLAVDEAQNRKIVEILTKYELVEIKTPTTETTKPA